MPILLRLLRRSLIGATFVLAGGAQAQGAPSDIDVYAGVSGTQDKPNVLFILDSSANWATSIPGAANCFYNTNGVATSSGPAADQGTKLGIEKCALYNLVDALPVAASGGPGNDALFNVAIMLLNEPNNNGGYPRQNFVPLSTTNKAALKTLISGFSKNGDKASNADYGQALYEAYLWFKGMAPLNGTAGSKWDSAAFAGGRYISPAANSCARNYVIVIGNGSPQNSNPEKQVQNLLAAQGGNTSVIVNPALGNDQANWSDEMARFMRGADFSNKDDAQGIVTHAVAVKKGPSDGDFPALMNSIANYGGGNYYEATAADVLLKALLDIFNQIQAVNSVFASASLPVSVNARGTYLNQIYMGMFRPDAAGRPRWSGNLKQYRFGVDSLNNIFIADSAGIPAINASTGFISPSAVSYWTTPSTFWANAPAGTPPTASDSPDGEVVEKGAAAEHLRSVYAMAQTARKVYTCVGCAAGTTLSAGGATDFSSANAAITQAVLGAASATERANIIDWVRGAANVGDETGPTTTPATTVRPSVHGDVLHSRPAVVNFGGNTGVVVFYGANDGQLHAVNGSQSGAGAGDELWSFVPEDVYAGLKRLRDNTPDIALSETPAGLGALPRGYFVDGPIGVYQKVAAAGTSDRVILYVGMRRGGRVLYAIDVTTPTAPKMLWKKTSGSAGMSQLGQTWSEPKAARLRGYPNPVVIMGGGYDATAEDALAPAAPTMGNVVMVLDAFDGTLLKTFSALSGATPAANIARPIAADLTLIDSDYDGYVDRAYAVDLGGQIYRLDFESATGNAAANWTVYKVADLSGGTGTGRKFLYAPDAVVTKSFTALMVGSGDREKPLLANTQDHYFQIFDRRTAKGAPATATPIVWSDLYASGNAPRVDGAGCYQALAVGEKVVNAATSIGGFSFFGTNRPSAASGNSCSANLGIAKSYAMPLFCTASSGSVLAGGGLPPSPVSGIVVVDGADGSSRQVPFVIGAPNPRNSAIEGSRVNPVIDVPRRRTYWYQEVER